MHDTTMNQADGNAPVFGGAAASRNVDTAGESPAVTLEQLHEEGSIDSKLSPQGTQTVPGAPGAPDVRNRRQRDPEGSQAIS